MNKNLIEIIKLDYFRYNYEYSYFKLILHKFKNIEFNYISLMRKCMYYRKKNKCLYVFFRLKYEIMSRKYSMHIPISVKIGTGFYISHFGQIIINPRVIIGNNVNIGAGVTIGQENRGKRKGTPTIGSEVWIGNNATIVGNVKIGNNVLIAPNSFINIDIPNDSIVIGNPAKIIKNMNATEDYINNKV